MPRTLLIRIILFILLFRLDTTNLHACIDVNSEKQFSADDLKKINVYRLYEVFKTLFTLNAYYLVLNSINQFLFTHLLILSFITRFHS